MNSKWSQNHKKSKHTVKQTNKKRQKDISVERISFVFFFSIYSIHLLHLDRNNVLQRVKWGKKNTGGTVPKINRKIIETDKIILYTTTYLTWLWDITCFDTDRSALYFDLHLGIAGEGRLRTKLYKKRDDFDFPIVNFPLICSNIPAAPAYGVYLLVDTIFQSLWFLSGFP